MSDSYLTITRPSEGIYKEKGSKFIAHAYPVESEEEVDKHIKQLKKDFYDARHHCYAFIIGLDKNHYRAGDDGEPSNSAGTPILGQIRSNELTNTLIVVVRYFGGTKLGVPGLINAYKSAAADAILNAKIITRHDEKTLMIHFSYPQMNDVMRIIKDCDLTIDEQTMELDCKMTLRIRTSLFEDVQEKLEGIFGVELD